MEGNPWGRRFTPEDFFLYLLTHMYKHYCGSGTGLRSLTDVYLFCRIHGEEMDRALVEQGLEQLELTAFARQICSLSQKLFEGNAALSREERSTLEYCLFSGTHGTARHHIQNQLQKMAGEGKAPTGKTKARYMLGRLFPDRAFMRKWCGSHAPFFLRHPRLLPLASWYRLPYNLVTGRGRRLVQELRTLWNK